MSLRRYALVLFLVSLWTPSGAHELHHDDTTVNYTDWVNGLGRGCCNRMDCGPAKDEDVSYAGHVAVRINDKWCPVLAHHYLKKGGASNANYSHVCVQPEYLSDEYGNELPKVDPCERLLCFQPKPLF